MIAFDVLLVIFFIDSHGADSAVVSTGSTSDPGGLNPAGGRGVFSEIENVRMQCCIGLPAQANARKFHCNTTQTTMMLQTFLFSQ